MQIKDRFSIGERIRYLRKSQGLTQKDLAKRLGVSPVNLSQIENGSRNLTIDTLQQIADAMGITLSDITSNLYSRQLTAENQQKTPAEGERPHVTDDDIKFALFGTTDIDDETFEDVKALARVAAEQAAKRKRKKQE